MSPLAEQLIALDVGPDVLRRDPAGRTWLPEELRKRVEADPDLAAELRTFVATELMLFDDADAGSDPFFTARVMQQLPTAPDAVSPLRRALVLMLFHVLGVASAYTTAWILAPQELMTWVDQAHVWVDQGWVLAGPWTLVATLLAAFVALVAFGRPRAHTAGS